MSATRAALITSARWSHHARCSILAPTLAPLGRSAVITTFWETGATQSQMDVLAELMAHSSDTARTFYFKPQMAKAAVDTNNRMLQALELAVPEIQV